MHDFLEIFLPWTYIASDNINARKRYHGGAIDRGKLLILIATTPILLILAFMQDEEQLGYSKRA